jgi:hypothetical protein
MARGRLAAAVVVGLAVMTAACGGGGAAGRAADPVAVAQDPATVLANAQYPELPVDGLRQSYLLDTGAHLTHVLLFVDGLRLDEQAATEGLRHFEQLRQEVALDVDGEGTPLTYVVRPRNVAQRYVVVVPDGAPLPVWAGNQEEGRSFVSSRPVNVDHAVTVIRVAEKPFSLGSPFDTMPPATQLDTVFLRGACARSTSIRTDDDAAYRYGANIHNRGENVICSAESRLLVGRRLAMPPAAMAEIVAANRIPATPAGGAVLAAPPFDDRRYSGLPKIGPIFTFA